MSSKEAYRFDGYERDNNELEYDSDDNELECEIKSSTSSNIRDKVSLLIGMIIVAAIITALVIIFVG